MIRQAFRQSQAILRGLRNERLAPEQVRELQQRRLRAMVEHAATNSPFYRAKFKAHGLEAADIQTLDDLPKLPLTTKQELLDAGTAQILASGYTPDTTILEPTSGSSGRVLQVYHTPEAFDTYFAFAFGHLWQLGYRPWYRVAYTAFDPLVSLPWEKIGLGTRTQVNLRQKDARLLVENLLAIKPQLITAYPSVLLLIIRSATAAELRQIRPRAIHLHSELLHDGIRDTIRMAFDCDCFDDYSTVEFHHVAYECRQHRYHLAADNVIAEFVRDGKAVAAGEEGEVVLTGLTNRAMPLLRYAIGDVGIPSGSGCACGSGFPSMALIQGRVDDYITMPSGRSISPRMVNPAFEHLPGMLEHVLVQEDVDRFVIHLRVEPAYSESLPALVKRVLAEVLDEPVQIEVKLTNEFERGRTGKLRCIVSKVKPAATLPPIVPPAPAQPI